MDGCLARLAGGGIFCLGGRLDHRASIGKRGLDGRVVAQLELQLGELHADVQRRLRAELLGLALEHHLEKVARRLLLRAAPADVSGDLGEPQLVYLGLELGHEAIIEHRHVVTTHVAVVLDKLERCDRQLVPELAVVEFAELGVLLR